MTVVRQTGRLRQMLRAAVAALGVLCLAACTDGYSTEDVAQVDPARMTHTQLLAALNALGKEPHLGKRWRYALHANCELEVSVRNGDTDRRRVVLEGAVVSTRSVDGVTEILLLPELGDDTQAVTVLATRKWTDTVQVKSLLTHLEVRCASPAAPTA
jgi:hypothetical protein